MSKFSINFENEEHYRKFIKSIKDEVVKDLNSTHPQGRPNWVLFKEELQNDIKRKREKDDVDIQHSTIAGYSDYYPIIKEAFNVNRVDMFNAVDQSKLRQFKDELFELIDKYRRDEK